MDAFIARKDDREILVARKDSMVIEDLGAELQAIERWHQRKAELKKQGYEIVHILSEAPEAKRVRKVKRVEIMGQKVVLDEEQD